MAVGSVPAAQTDPALIADNPPAPSPDAPWRLNPGSYPDDNSQVAIGCGGGCPPAWQLEADYRDRRMIMARVQHCYELVGGGKKGRIQVSVDIDALGHARSVKAKHTGAIPDLVDQCAEELLMPIKFQATNNYVRSPGFDEEYPKAKNAEP